ncbi:hypothetical protein F2Q69_00014921 [Brassica cretica]|uniref:Uncharacterized protein n=1 Tax=Brassica cretica TaxID=69181 RepID=A0A8S9QW62_BRACR|nr:hypothetical protein F2Q69_00014921 [Brassica cretica]
MPSPEPSFPTVVVNSGSEPTSMVAMRLDSVAAALVFGRWGLLQLRRRRILTPGGEGFHSLASPALGVSIFSWVRIVPDSGSGVVHGSWFLCGAALEAVTVRSRREGRDGGDLNTCPASLTRTITQLFGAGESECSVILLWTYALASVSLTVWPTFFMWLVA